MISKPIFKQTLKSNYILWLIFTAILCVFSAVIIITYDPSIMSSMMDMVEEMGMADMMGDRMSGMTSLLGTLGNSFYSMLAVILPLIFIIITANSLVASQVDRGSMAYLLSTPTKRSTVVRTQGIYLITSILCMFLVVTIVGLTTVQITQGSVFGTAHTGDVKAVSTLLDKDKEDVADDLNLILNNEEALKEGAKARNIDVDVYTAYLNLKISNNAYQAAADVLDKDVEEVKSNPALIKSNEEALNAAANVMGIDSSIYSMYLDTVIAASAQTEESDVMQEKVMAGLTSAAEVLDMEVADLASDMGKVKNNEAALNAAVDASGIQKEAFISIINQQLASKQISLDEGIDFSVKDYLMLNLGCFLLMFAISSISFLFSCIFNLSKNSLALGAGIPIAFFVFQIMGQISESMEGFKYLSLNTLFDTEAVISGGNYWVQYVILAAVGVVLYVIGMRAFKEKDLPL